MWRSLLLLSDKLNNIMSVELHITPHRKDEVGAALLYAFLQLEDYISGLPEDVYLSTLQGKWSPGQQLQHLIASASPVALSLHIPKIVFLPFGKDTNRASRSYGEIGHLYLSSLGGGAKSSFLFTPSPIAGYNLDKRLKDLEKVLENIKTGLYLHWNESDLDTYRMPHPILGMLTIREMLFFTVFHTLYHLNSMLAIYGEGK